VQEVSPQLALGEAARGRFQVLENGLRFELDFCAGPSVGLFLDQRDNRRRLLTGHVAAGFPLFASVEPPTSSLRRSAAGAATADCACPFVLNTFAYTCAFSACAAKAGARTTSIDLSRTHLDWGRRNFALNQIDPAAHDFIYGDVFDWLRRLARKPRLFDAVLLDPPTFSRSKHSGIFRAARDYGKLLAAALPLLKPGGVLFASTNAAEWPPEDFVSTLESAVRAAGRKLLQRHYVPQPADFPISRFEPAYLKTVWLRVG
jgi:23S rRNA (cytosine1962-C5)-methyltransferase